MKGRKIHALVDTQGLPLRIVIHSAGVQDRDGAALVLDKIRNSFPWLELLWADSGYNAHQVDAAVAKVPSHERIWKNFVALASADGNLTCCTEPVLVDHLHHRIPKLHPGPHSEDRSLLGLAPFDGAAATYGRYHLVMSPVGCDSDLPEDTHEFRLSGLCRRDMVAVEFLLTLTWLRENAEHARAGCW